MSPRKAPTADQRIDGVIERLDAIEKRLNIAGVERVDLDHWRKDTATALMHLDRKADHHNDRITKLEAYVDRLRALERRVDAVGAKVEGHPSSAPPGFKEHRGTYVPDPDWRPPLVDDARPVFSTRAALERLAARLDALEGDVRNAATAHARLNAVEHRIRVLERGHVGAELTSTEEPRATAERTRLAYGNRPLRCDHCGHPLNLGGIANLHALDIATRWRDPSSPKEGGG